MTKRKFDDYSNMLKQYCELDESIESLDNELKTLDQNILTGKQYLDQLKKQRVECEKVIQEKDQQACQIKGEIDTFLKSNDGKGMFCELAASAYRVEESDSESEEEEVEETQLDISTKFLENKVGKITSENLRQLKDKIFNAHENKDKQLLAYQYLKQFSLDEKDEKMKTLVTSAANLISAKHRQILPEITDLTKKIEFIKEELNKKICGLDSEKVELLSCLIPMIQNEKFKPHAYALHGPAGTGKTELVRSLAKITGLPFLQISLGGMKDVYTLTGFEYTYTDSQPGSLVKFMSECGCTNPIIFFDELDKVSEEEVTSFLIHLTDPVQNNDVSDNFMGKFRIDFSNVWFIFSLNNKNCVSPILLDRLHLIEMKSQVNKEDIITKYMLPKVLLNNNITCVSGITQDAIRKLISANDKSMRGLLDSLSKVARKINYALIDPTYKEIKLPGSPTFLIDASMIDGKAVDESPCSHLYL